MPNDFGVSKERTQMRIGRATGEDCSAATASAHVLRRTRHPAIALQKARREPRPRFKPLYLLLYLKVLMGRINFLEILWERCLHPSFLLREVCRRSVRGRGIVGKRENSHITAGRQSSVNFIAGYVTNLHLN